MDRDDRVTGRDEGVDHQARGAFDGDGQFGRGGKLAQAGKQFGETGGIVVRLEAGQDGARRVEDADGVAGAAPVETGMEWHGLTSSGWDRPARAGRSCGSLTDRRSGWQALARHPGVRLDLPAPAARRVSPGPSSGKRRRPSRQALGLSGAEPRSGVVSDSPKVHQ